MFPIKPIKLIMINIIIKHLYHFLILKKKLVFLTLSPEYLIDLYHHIPTVVGRAIIKTNA